MKIRISYDEAFNALCSLNSQEPQCWFPVKNKTKNKDIQILKNGEKAIGYIVNKLDSGIQLLPVFGDKTSQSLSPEEIIFLSNEDIENVSILRRFDDSQMWIKLKSGVSYKFSFNYMMRGYNNKQNMRIFRSNYLKASRKIEALYYFGYIALILIIVVTINVACDYYTSHTKYKAIGQELIKIAEQDESGNLYTPLLPYDKGEFALDGEIQTYENDYYSFNFPVDFVKKETTNESSAAYKLPDESMTILISEPEGHIFEESAFDFAEPHNDLYQKYFGVKLDSQYNSEKIGYSVNFNDLDVNNFEQCVAFLTSYFRKSTMMSNSDFYNIENEDYCGFVIVSGEDNPVRKLVIFEIYKKEDLNHSFQISFMCQKAEQLDDAYAIINSFAFK